jgi:hypothetical protein
VQAGPLAAAVSACEPASVGAPPLSFVPAAPESTPPASVPGGLFDELEPHPAKANEPAISEARERVCVSVMGSLLPGGLAEGCR